MKNILLVGVGGQGILTLSRLIGEAAINAGLDVLISEVHGMAQRGGSVVVHVKVGDKVYSPLITVSDADWIIALEIMECCRYIHYASNKTKAILNDRLIPPPVLDKPIPEKEEMLNKLRNIIQRIYVIPAHEIALKLGLPILTNTVIFGVSAKLNILDIKERYYVEALRKVFPEKYFEINFKAYKEGLNFTSTLIPT